MREPHYPESEVCLPMPDLFNSSPLDWTITSQRHIIQTNHTATEAIINQTVTEKRSGPVNSTESHIDTVRTPVAETQITNPEQTTLSTSIGDRKTYCRSTFINKIKGKYLSTTEDSDKSDSSNTVRHNQEPTSLDENQDAVAHIELKIAELLQTEIERQCVEDTGHRDGNVNILDKQQVNNKQQQNENNNMEQRNIDGQGETQQEGSERRSKRKRLRRRQKKQQQQSETSWSEDVEDYKGYKPIDELVKFITS